MKEGLFGSCQHGSATFKNVLWTMRAELLWSFGLYVFFQFILRCRLRMAAALAVVMVVLRIDAGCGAFGLGVCLCLAHQVG